MLLLDFKRGQLVLYGDCQFLKPIGTKSFMYILSRQYCLYTSWFLRHLFRTLLNMILSIGVDTWSTGIFYLFRLWPMYCIILQCIAFQFFNFREFCCIDLLPFCFFSFFYLLFCLPEEFFVVLFSIFFLPFQLISFSNFLYHF